MSPSYFDQPDKTLPSTEGVEVDWKDARQRGIHDYPTLGQEPQRTVSQPEQSASERITASIDASALGAIFMAFGLSDRCYLTEEGDAVWEWYRAELRLTLSTDCRHWHVERLRPEKLAPDPMEEGSRS